MGDRNHRLTQRKEKVAQFLWHLWGRQRPSVLDVFACSSGFLVGPQGISLRSLPQDVAFTV